MNNGNAVASSSKRTLTPVDSIRVSRRKSSSPPAAVVFSSPPSTALSPTSPVSDSTPVTSESNDLLRMIVEKLDLGANKTDLQTSLLRKVLKGTADAQMKKVGED